ncbi:MAG TPA: transglycosylase SLT domain-containing protein [Alphaproteobacteria bacterium]|jgi:hypothetical protein|nr:transglycosylase SLT domain-containing protein [Alphaproteobacteria bacterium]
MTAALSAAKAGNVQKYQAVASQNVIQAVQKASARTGVDFSFLMEKAAAESSFNPTAKAKTSSATGLYQFIESTWLNMVKNHGDKYGLGEYADKIEIKNGKPCVADCDREEILKLRNDPEIAALMAGEFTADNKNFLKRNVGGDIGSTELYFAHFMGAGGAAKFLNSRNINGDVTAAELFPAAAKANKNVFYNHKTGEARSLDEVYAYFDKKFSGTAATPAKSAAKANTALAEVPRAAAQNPIDAHVARMLPVFDDADESDDIIWNDDPRFFPKSGFSSMQSVLGVQKLAPGTVMMIAEMQRGLIFDNRERYNS